MPLIIINKPTIVYIIGEFSPAFGNSSSEGVFGVSVVSGVGSPIGVVVELGSTTSLRHGVGVGFSGVS